MCFGPTSLARKATSRRTNMERRSAYGANYAPCECTTANMWQVLGQYQAVVTLQRLTKQASANGPTCCKVFRQFFAVHASFSTGISDLPPWLPTRRKRHEEIPSLDHRRTRGRPARCRRRVNIKSLLKVDCLTVAVKWTCRTIKVPGISAY